MDLQLSFTWLDATLIALAGILLIPISFFGVECLMALLPIPLHRQSQESKDAIAPAPLRLAVLVPAHNEAAMIQATLRSLLRQLSSRTQVIVIADNCTDQTADLARACGVTVLERVEPNPKLRGKGYALDFGLRYLAQCPPDVVVMVDGDCLVAPGTIARIAQQAARSGRPVQACYLMRPPAQPRLQDHISALAVFVKNQVRPLGLSRLGFPNLLTGSGMAFPWQVIQQVSLAGSKTCDDMQTSIDLAIAGYPPTYCPQTQVMGRLMANHAAFNQRSRWEHGHLEMFTTQIPRLLTAAWTQRRFDLLVLALEIAIPPLALLVLAWSTVLILALLHGVCTQSWMPALILELEGLLLVVAVLGCWWHSRHTTRLTLWQLMGIPLYTLCKIPLYIQYLIKPQTRWLQTERD